MDACKACGGLFRRHYSRGNQRQIYCSKKCRYADSYIDKTCLTCGKAYRINAFSRNKNNQFCSLECITRGDCLMCGMPITGRNNMNGRLRIFCCRACAVIHNRTLDPNQKTYRLVGFAYTIARLGKLACERCGIDELAVLHVHHIRGRREGSARTNLETVCANCHDREHREGTAKRAKDASRAKAIAPMLVRRLAEGIESTPTSARALRKRAA